jgi:hypothetical protein
MCLEQIPLRAGTSWPLGKTDCVAILAQAQASAVVGFQEFDGRFAVQFALEALFVLLLAGGSPAQGLAASGAVEGDAVGGHPGARLVAELK